MKLSATTSKGAPTTSSAQWRCKACPASSSGSQGSSQEVKVGVSW